MESRCCEVKARRREKSINKDKILISHGNNMVFIFIDRFLTTSVAIEPEVVRNDTLKL